MAMNANISNGKPMTANPGGEAAQVFDHVHGYIMIRLPLLFAFLRLVHLPRGWLVASGSLPHDPDCTPTNGVLSA
jgi:hypothetical protein